MSVICVNSINRSYGKNTIVKLTIKKLKEVPSFYQIMVKYSQEYFKKDNQFQ